MFKGESIHVELSGLTEIWRPRDCTPEIDVIAIHGLNGHPMKTWTSKKGRICWLNHEDYLPKHVPNARVLVYGHTARMDFLERKTRGNETISDLGQILLSHLAADRRLSGTEKNPIIFICHSLGGLVLKKALCAAHIAKNNDNDQLYNIFSSTHSIMFFGTPHLGSEKAELLESLLKLTPFGTRKSKVLSALSHESEVLRDLNRHFVSLMKNFRIYFFWELQKTRIGMLGEEFIVPESSAAPTYDEAERAGIAASHGKMVKFDSPTDSGFRMVADALQRYAAEAVEEVHARHCDTERELGLRRQGEADAALDGEASSMVADDDDPGYEARGTLPSSLGSLERDPETPENDESSDDEIIAHDRLYSRNMTWGTDFSGTTLNA